MWKSQSPRLNKILFFKLPWFVDRCNSFRKGTRKGVPMASWEIPLTMKATNGTDGETLVSARIGISKEYLFVYEDFYRGRDRCCSAFIPCQEAERLLDFVILGLSLVPCWVHCRAPSFDRINRSCLEVLRHRKLNTKQLPPFGEAILFFKSTSFCKSSKMCWRRRRSRRRRRSLQCL